MKGYEVNFDGLVGPTHHYAGLSFGNEASTKNRNNTSNPKLAAKQGLLKMKALADMGMKQGVLAPHERPHVPMLRRLGFTGDDISVVAQAMRYSPELLSSLSSASPMWTANAATVSPSADSQDERVHFTAANLNNKFHRSIEAETTSQVLQAIFKNERHFVHHEALPQVALFGDEGAANHNRLGGDYAHTVFVQQNPDVIDQGVFHNDVIAVSNQQVLFHHQHAFLNQDQAFAEIRQKMASIGEDFISIEVPENRVTVDDAVATYLFNSQILTRPDGGMTIVVPEESRQNAAVWSYLNDMIQMGTPIDAIQVYDLRESMRNGGGPACLRLRVALNETELNAANPKVLMNDQLFMTLNQWVDKHYRDRLAQEDLADPHLLMESRMALDELTKILGLGSVYPFQK